MPSVLKIDQRRRIVVSSFYGKVTDEELLAHGSFIARDPDFNREFNEIVDFTEVKEAAVSEQTLLSLAGNQSLFNSTAVHVVVVRNGRIASLVEKFKSLARDTRPRLFVVHTVDEAYELLAEDKKRPQAAESADRAVDLECRVRARENS